MPNSYSLGRSRSSAKSKTTELTLPSFALDEEGNETAEHNKCLARVMDPVAMIQADLLDGFDDLTALAAAKISEVDGKSVVDPSFVKELSTMGDKLTAGLDMVDRLVEAVVVEPKVVWPVHRHPEGHELAGKPMRNRDGSWMRLGPDERDNDTLYTDDVDLEDRMFILSWAVGGIKDVKQFRGEYTGLLESVEDGEVLPLSALGSPWAK